MQWQNIDTALELCRQDGRLSAGGAVQVEHRSPLGGRQLSASGPAGEAAATDRRRPRRADRAGRLLRQRVDRPLPAGGTAAADAMGHYDRPALRREGRVGDDQRRAGLHLGHRAGHGPGRREVLLRSGQTTWIASDERDHVGGQAVLLARPRRPTQSPLLDSLQGLWVRELHRIQAGAAIAGAPCAVGEEGLSLRHRANAMDAAATTSRPTRRCPTW